jgi:hypothetical protein
MVSPYNDRRYGGALSATRGFLDAFKEYQEMRWKMRQSEIMTQYRQSLMAQHRDVTEQRRLRMPFLRGQSQAAEKALAGEELTETDKLFLGKTGPQVQIFTPGQTESVEEGISRMLSVAGGVEKKVSREKALQVYDAAKQKYAGQIKDPNQFDAIFDTTAAGMGIYGEQVGEVDWNPSDLDVQDKRPYFQYGPQEEPTESIFTKPEDKPSLFKRALEGWPSKNVVRWGVKKLYGPKEKPSAFSNITVEGARDIFTKYGEAWDELSDEDKAAIDEAWAEAEKKNMSAKRFMDLWRATKNK